MNDISKDPRQPKVGDYLHDEYELEMLGITQGVDRWNAPFKLKKSGKSTLGVSQASPGRKLVRGWLDAMIDAIEIEQLACCNGVGGVGRQNYGPMLIWGDADQLALITLSTILDCSATDNREIGGLLKPPTAHHVCKEIGIRVKTQYTIDEVRQYEPKFVRLAEKITKGWTPRAVRWLKEKTGRATKPWSYKDYTCVGSILLLIALEHTPLFDRKMVSEKKKNKYLIRLSDEARELYDKHVEIAELRYPVMNPMVVPPLPVREGGPFIYMPSTHIKSHKTPYLPDTAQARFDVLDYNNNVPWAIEPRTVAVMEELYFGSNRGVRVNGTYIVPPLGSLLLPPRDHDRMKFDEDYRKQWRGDASIVYSDNIKLNSKRLEFESAMKQGRKFEKYDQFHFTYTQGWRGRFYPDQGGMQPQGSDPGRGMLVSGRKVPLGEHGFNWMRVHTANLFGVDKVPYADRIAWVIEHERDIFDSARNPTTGDRFWMTADDPWQALTAVNALTDAYNAKSQREFLSDLICKIDGSCNGLQHLSAMGRDPVGGLLVNLIPGTTPEDIYRAVGEKLWEQVQRDYLEHVNEPGIHPSAFWYALLSDPKMRRKVAKRGTMTTPYGVTLQGLRDQLISEGFTNDWKIADYLKVLLDKAIRQVVIKGKLFMDWMQLLAELTNGPMRWTLGTGFEVFQDYKSSRERRIKTAFGDMQQFPFTDKTDKRAQIRGAVPNGVHSFDGEHWCMVCLEMMRRNYNVLQGVHDAFGTVAGWMEALASIAPNTFVDLHLTDPHVKMLNELRQQYPDIDLPDPPEQGELDLNRTRQSPYAFS